MDEWGGARCGHFRKHLSAGRKRHVRLTLDANGFPSQGDFGNAFLRISTANQKLAVADYFEMFNQGAENGSDEDLGSGGALLLPDFTDSSGQTRHLAVGAGKDSNIYVVDRDAMGKFSPSKNNIYQEIQGGLSGSVFSMPAYFNNTVYYGAVGDKIKAFAISNAQLAGTPAIANRQCLRLSWRDSEHFCQWDEQCDSMGGRKRRQCGSACLRCDQSFA